MLEIKNLTKSYGDVLALDRFSLDLEKGEVLGLLVIAVFALAVGLTAVAGKFFRIRD